MVCRNRFWASFYFLGLGLGLVKVDVHPAGVKNEDIIDFEFWCVLKEEKRTNKINREHKLLCLHHWLQVLLLTR